jgi:ABC-2 type transport system permease protein
MRLRAIILKEFLHIFRDSRTLFLVLLMPVFMIFLYGWAVNLDAKNIQIAVADLDQSPASRYFIDKFAQSKYFQVTQYVTQPDEFEDLFRRYEVRAGITVPADFGKSIGNEFATSVQLIVDGYDGNTAQTVLNYARAIVAQYNTELLPQGFEAPIEVIPRFLYNPSLESGNFIVPGLAAVILMMISALLTSVSIVREKETGTLEQILVTPVHVIETIVGKVIPYVFLAFMDGMLTIGIGVLVFDVQFEGAAWVLLTNTLVYLYSALALGLLISTLASTQQAAMATALMLTLLPSIMLSGFMFPIAGMPLILQVITRLIPATYFLEIIRGVLLKGTGYAELYHNTLILFGIGTLFLLLAIRKFKVRLG